MDYGVIAFSSTFSAMYGEKVLKETVSVQVMPVLREISAGCGIAVRFRGEDLARVRHALAHCDLKPGDYTLYAVTGGGSSLTVTPL